MSEISEVKAQERLVAAAPALLALARQYASECAECGGSGVDPRVTERPPAAGPAPCAECADIRAVIARATEPPPAKTAKDLIAELVTTEFECGEWDKNESDVPFEEVYAAAQAAKVALEARVDHLVNCEAELRVLVAALAHLGIDGTNERDVNGGDVVDYLVERMPAMQRVLEETP